MKKCTRIQINKEQLCFLEKLAKCPVARGEKRFSRRCVFKTILNVVNKSSPDVSGVRNEVSPQSTTSAHL
jgi:hypothetical protein